MKDEKEAKHWMSEASKEARQSICLRSKCGAVIVKNEEIIGVGHNSPPADSESQRRCLVEKNTLHKKITDKTCCVHAEQRAIINTLTKNPEKIKGAELYFIRLDEKNQEEKSGQPYCTICSKMALDVGISKFFLWHKEGIHGYPTDKYNQLSYKYTGSEK